MGSVRGRTLLDLARHRLGWTARGGFDTKEFWEAKLSKSGPAARRAASFIIIEVRISGCINASHSNKSEGHSDVGPGLPRAAKTLVLGGGTSTLGHDLIDTGWSDVTVGLLRVAVKRDWKWSPR